MLFRNELPLIEQIKIPRCILYSSTEPVDFYGFCDASEKAYAAVIYAKTVSLNGTVKVEIVTGKCKVSPVKAVTLPKLELCAAALLSRMVESSQKCLSTIHVKSVKCFSDSTIVLAWLAKPPQTWKTFVSNRVAQVQEVIPYSSWCHVRSEDNPADCASRGIPPSSLKNHGLWWKGPAWLLENTEDVSCNHATKNTASLTQPKYSVRSLVSTTNGICMKNLQLTPEEMDIVMQEEKKSIIVNHIALDTSLLSTYSSLSKLKRIMALCLRFIFNARVKDIDNRREGPITVKELDEALTCCIRIVQLNEFSKEIPRLQKKIPLPNASKIISLSPFLDKNGLIRVGGRLSKSNLTPDRKNPILLPKKHHFTHLIIESYHRIYLHAGPQLLLASLQRKFWILGGRDIVRQIVLKCVVCHRQKAAMGQQMMGDLPAARVTPTRPFLKTGVDYAGPFLLRRHAGRPTRNNPEILEKAYVSLFVCFSTRAIHLELVSDLTTEAFVAALKRFVSRRGKCSDIYSDCGTNFVGASNEFKEFSAFINRLRRNEKVSKHLADDGIKWHFIPPGGPHFGGLWEAGVKSVKFHLRRVIGSARLNFEEMTTLLTQVEACLNSRPLTPVSTDPADLSVLTPGHFLIGDALTAIPEPDVTTIKENRLNKWQKIQQMLQHFWHRWSAEHLSRLQQRPKWFHRKENMKKDDIVLIKDEDLPPLKWKLGRIVELHPGKDGLVRVATVRTSEGVYKRPVVKLSVLPFETEEQVLFCATPPAYSFKY